MADDGGQQRFYGKYRGQVTANADPQQLGRLQVTVPALPGVEAAWALPSVPYAGDGVGFYAMPPVDAHVWVEFEGGDLDAPIWSGCFWGDGQTPGEPIGPEVKVWRTRHVNLVLDDREGEGGFTLEVDEAAAGIGPLVIRLDKAGITLECQSSVASTIRLQPDGITVEHPQASLVLQADRIVARLPPSSHTIQADGITAEAPPGKHTVSSSGGVVSEFPPGKTSVTTMGVLSEAGGGSAKVLPATVEIQAPLVKIN